MYVAAFSLVSAFIAHGFDVDGCTSVVVSAEGTLDGSAITSHANDCADCDFRMVYVPARDHPAGSKRLIYDAVWSQYPRLVDQSRSEQYQAGAGINSTKVLGSIPQVDHTFALWEASYGLMNEHGLAMGESTCPSFLIGTGVDAGGEALLTIGNLMNIALERCVTARCAVSMMGSLGEKYGFFGEDPGLGGAGEAVTVVDKLGEAWVFHITGGLNGDGQWQGQRGALWAAQRVPPGHVAAVANSFIIRDINVSDPENFMFHPGLFELAQEAGLWNGTGSFDFHSIMQPDLSTFSYFPGYPPIPLYSSLRLWGIFRHAASRAGLQPTTAPRDFPFSVPLDHKVSHLDIMNWFRDHYENTAFDMRYGSMAGPWGSPNRAEGGKGQVERPGQFARAVSIPRTSYTVLLQSGKIAEPTVWFAPDAAASSVFVPFFSSVLTHGGGRFDRETFGEGSMKSLRLASTTLQPAWWAFDLVANWMEVSYQNMSETYVYPQVQSLQQKVANEVQSALASASKLEDRSAAGRLLAIAQTNTQRSVTVHWWSLAEKLIVRYNDAFFNFPEHAPTAIGTIGYPTFWLEMLGYSNDFYRPHWIQPASIPPQSLPAGVRSLFSDADHADHEDMAVPLNSRQGAAFNISLPVALALAAAWLCGLVLGALIYRTLQRNLGAQSTDHYVKIMA